MARYRNNRRGALAYDPVLLLNVILFGYSKGITSSRGVEALREQEASRQGRCEAPAWPIA